MNIQETLEAIGFNHHESKIYLLLLELGTSSASRIAKNTKTPRSTIRSILDKLCERGVVSKVFKGNVQQYSCEPVRKLTKLVESNIEKEKGALTQLNDVLPLLNSLWGKQSYVPKVKFFEGEKGIIEAFNHSLYVDAKEILFMTSFRFFDTPLLKKNDMEFYVPMRVKKQIPLRVIARKCKQSVQFKKQGGKELREMKFSPKKFCPPGNVHIYGDFVVFFSGHDREYMAVLIESAVIADTMRVLFEFMWKSI